jgi:UDP-glucose 4-epimerase
MPRVVVTGASGYIGSHICHELLSQGFEIVAIDDLSTGRRDFINPRVDFFEGKVQDEQFLSKVFSNFSQSLISGVIHCAGLKFAGESVKAPLTYYENNSVAMQVLLKVMEAFQIKNLVFSSSCSVYGTVRGSKPVNEDSPKLPVSPYGRSKLFAEHMITDAMSASSLKSVALRYFNVAGNIPGVGFDISQYNLMPNIYRSIEARSEFSVFGGDYDTPDGSCIRDYVDVSLLAKAHIVALQKLIDGSTLEPAYNLGSGYGASVLEILATAKSEISNNLDWSLKEARSGDPAQILADVSLARRDLNWEHTTSISEMILSGWNAWINR